MISVSSVTSKVVLCTFVASVIPRLSSYLSPYGKSLPFSRENMHTGPPQVTCVSSPEVCKVDMQTLCVHKHVG